jgi:predicted transcriptional regulator of viral defense system
MSTGAGISAQGRKELTAVLGETRRFIAPGDVAAALGVDSESAARKLARWSHQGWVRRVRRGLYIAVPVDAAIPAGWSEDPLVVAAEVWAPCYFTGWTAARHWGLTEQVFRTTVLKTSERVRASTTRLLDHEYLVSHTHRDALAWGLKSEWRQEVRLRFADAPRTVVESLDAPRIGGGIRHVAEVLIAYLDDHPPEALIESGDRFGNRAVFKRLGYLIEALGLDEPLIASACEERVSAGISALDPDGPTDGHRVTRWGLLVNVNVVYEGAS